MKRIVLLATMGFPISASLVFGQPAVITPQATAQIQSGPGTMTVPKTEDITVKPVTFDLDFPGGPPQALVEAIEKAAERPVNAIVSEEYANIRIPALKLRGVSLAQLFDAIQVASQKTILQTHPNNTVSRFTESYGFRTTPTDSTRDFKSIWNFYHETPHVPTTLQRADESKICRFYQLAYYLSTFKVEDITTAVQTGCKMLGNIAPPQMNFHADTKLLIAVGKPEQLRIIDDVLKELAGAISNTSMRRPTTTTTAEPAKKSF